MVWSYTHSTLASTLYPLSFSLSGKIVDVAVSADGMLLCTTADDKSLKVFDVLNFGKYHPLHMPDISVEVLFTQIM